MHYSGICLVVISVLLVSKESSSCDTEFHGFGVQLGAVGHFNGTSEKTVQAVLDHLYHDLKIRHFRTSYEQYFSPSEGVYDLSCHDVKTGCSWAWESIMFLLSNKTRYPEPTLMASVWAPPLYMMDPVMVKLKPEYELQFYYYIKNITQLIHEKYGLTIDHVSPVNEPENVFATWGHCNMNPAQLCRIVTAFNDSLISLCPENAYFWVTQLFMNYNDSSTKCLMDSCRIVATHSYRLNVNASSVDFKQATYDLEPYQNTFGNKPIWMTEVSSTFHGASEFQMKEGLELAMNIVNFLGTTCVERYYYWLAFTDGTSGESLIWGHRGKLRFPKKYYVYKHFTNASASSSANGPVRITTCSPEDSNSVTDSAAHCLHFDSRTTVFVNSKSRVVPLEETTDCSCGLCCTTEDVDSSCAFSRRELPAKSVCTCTGGCGYNRMAEQESPTTRLPSFVFGYFFIDNLLRYLF